MFSLFRRMTPGKSRRNHHSSKGRGIKTHRRNITFRSNFFFLFLAAALFLLLAAGSGGARGETITVDDSGSADYEKIQDAIDNATEGDTIRVWEGTYYENVVVNKTITLIGNGSETTTIDGGGSSDVVLITVDWVNMSGFSVTGSGSLDYPDPDAGIKVEANHSRLFNNNCSNNHYGIRLSFSSDSTINNNTCENNTCNNNSVFGISFRSSKDSRINNNTCNNNREGIGIGGSSSYCTIENNSCNNNFFGIGLSFSSDSTIENNTCSENNVSNRGSTGISLSYSHDCLIINNTCSNSYGDGIGIRSSSDSTIENNTCNNNDNGIYFSHSEDCTITNNTCSENYRYGIYLHTSNNNIISNNICLENDYLGIWLYQSKDCRIENNKGRIEETYYDDSVDGHSDDGHLPGFGGEVAAVIVAVISLKKKRQ